MKFFTNSMLDTKAKEIQKWTSCSYRQAWFWAIDAFKKTGASFRLKKKERGNPSE